MTHHSSSDPRPPRAAHARSDATTGDPPPPASLSGSAPARAVRAMSPEQRARLPRRRAFVFVGRLCVDLVMTGGDDWLSVWEVLHEPADLDRWLATGPLAVGNSDPRDDGRGAARGLADAHDPEAAASGLADAHAHDHDHDHEVAAPGLADADDLEAARALRRALTAMVEALLAGELPAAEHVEAIDARVVAAERACRALRRRPRRARAAGRPRAVETAAHLRQRRLRAALLRRVPPRPAPLVQHRALRRPQPRPRLSGAQAGGLRRAGRTAAVRCRPARGPCDRSAAAQRVMLY
jgi:hypothetical protein